MSDGARQWQRRERSDLQAGFRQLLQYVIGAVLALRYKVVAVGAEHVPAEGPVLLLGNHVSWLDWALIQLPLKRPLRFMIDRTIYEWKWLHWLFRLGGTIPVSPKASKGAIEAAQKVLQNAEAVVIFPEGGITRSCKIEKFYRGFEIIASKIEDGVIVPFYIDGMCGSRWSRSAERFTPRRKGWRRVVTIYYGVPLPKESGADTVRSNVNALKDSIAK